MKIRSILSIVVSAILLGLSQGQGIELTLSKDGKILPCTFNLGEYDLVFLTLEKSWERFPLGLDRGEALLLTAQTDTDDPPRFQGEEVDVRDFDVYVSRFHKYPQEHIVMNNERLRQFMYRLTVKIRQDGTQLRLPEKMISENLIYIIKDPNVRAWTNLRIVEIAEDMLLYDDGITAKTRIDNDRVWPGDGTRLEISEKAFDMNCLFR